MATQDKNEPAQDPSPDAMRSDLTDWTTWPDEKLLDVRLCDLDLKIAGSNLEDRIAQLYHELDARGLHFHPHFWLSTRRRTHGSTPPDASAEMTSTPAAIAPPSGTCARPVMIDVPRS